MCRKSRENCKKYAHMIGTIVDHRGELWKIGNLHEGTYGTTRVLLYRNPIEKGDDNTYYATDTRRLYTRKGIINGVGKTKIVVIGKDDWQDKRFSYQVKTVDKEKLCRYTEDQLILVMDIPEETWLFLQSKPKNELNRKLSKLNSMLCGGVA